MLGIRSVTLALACLVLGAQAFVPPTPNRMARFKSGPLMAVKEVKSADEFDTLVTEAKGKLVVVDYSTTWCGPCKLMAPKFEDFSNRYDAVFVKVIGDSCQDASKLLKREGVRSVPAFHFWKGGKKVDTVSGADPEKLESAIADNV